MSYLTFKIDFENKDAFCTTIGLIKPNQINLEYFWDDYFRLRHDILHYVVSLSLFNRWVPEKRMNEIFPDYNGRYCSQTPDIIMNTPEVLYIMDVGITNDLHKMVLEKTTKYEPLCFDLELLLRKPVKFIPLIYSTRSPNLPNIKSSLQFLIKYDFSEGLFSTCNELLQNVYDSLPFYYDTGLINEYKRRYFERNMSNYVPDIIVKKDTKIKQSILDDIYNKKYPHEIIVGDENIDFFKKFINDENYDTYKDLKNDPKYYQMAYDYISEKNNEYLNKPRPVLYFLFPEKEDIIITEDVKLDYNDSLEQQNIINFMLYIKNNLKITDEKSSFLLNLSNSFDDLFIKSKKRMNNWFMFTKNDFFQTDDVKKKYFKEVYGSENISTIKNERSQLRKKLNKIKKSDVQTKEDIMEMNNIKEKLKSKKNVKKYYNFCVENNHFSKEEMDIDYNVKKNKMIRLSDKYLKSNKALNYYLKSGVGFYKNDLHLNNREQIWKTASMSSSKYIDGFLNYINQDIDYNFFDKDINDYYDFCVDDKDYFDSISCNELRKTYTNEYKSFLRRILNKRSTRLLWFSHLVYSQLMHLMSYSNRNEDFTFINCGVPNFLIIMTGGYRSSDSDTKKSFMSMCLTKKPELYTKIYGNLTKYHIKDGVYLVSTGWRRLTLEKCTFSRDSFYSVLSTTMSAYFDYPTEDYDYYEEMHSIKTLISLCPNQKNAEILMDNRYAFMSSFSSHTNIYKLLIDKFKPPYHDCLTVWLIKRIFQKYPIITKGMLEENLVKTILPVYNDDRRDQKTYGGLINVPSIWTNHTCTDINQILDEAFIYVLTIKEPSSLFHEKVKAINTIIEYQQMFDNTPDKFKYGWVHTTEDLFEFANYRLDNNIGFSSTVIYNSFDNLIKQSNINFDKIVSNVLQEHIGEVTSTKAVIHSLEREINEEKLDKISKGFVNRKLKRIIRTTGKVLSEIDKGSLMTKFNRKFNSKFYGDNKERQRVWETIIEFLSENKDVETVEDGVEKFLTSDKGKMEADICIKSQYGGKREFYVINIGAKFAARIVEKFFNELAKYCPSECISIPGDKKLIKMQQVLDEATRYQTKNGLKLRYVNGDCTKWSAAETMGSFITMCEVLKKYVEPGFYKLLRTIFSLWADKKINIPLDIVEKVMPLISKTSYLKIDHTKKQIHSTQNFLQGMFNYASSIKSTSCSNYTNYIWKKIYPESKLQCYHMEHSDDYVQIIVYENEIEFEDYRKLHKLMMKLHGFNDSDRKTSCQVLFMEFVSLMSFNGQMLYPKIKKTKEINLNLPCTGYKFDMEAALSRQGECLRMGCNLSYCYYFMKSHVYCVAEAYSLLKNMRNYFKDYKNKPIELFGLPDQLPFFSLLCKGNVNNYRLYKYGDFKTKQILTGLINLSIQDSDNIFLDHNYYESSIYTPIFTYDMNDKILKTFKSKLQLDFDEIRNFWKDHISYKFVKPRTNETLLKWLKYKFLDRSFLEAYTMTSRTKMTMRLSRYVSKNTLKENIQDDDLYNLRDIHDRVMQKISQVCDIYPMNDIMNLLTKSDPSVSTIYTIINTSTFIRAQLQKNKTRGMYTPHKLTWFNIENEPGVLLQYFLNYDDFIKDNRKGVNLYSLECDVKILKKYYEKILNVSDENRTRAVLMLYNDLTITKYKRVVMMGYNPIYTTLIDVLTNVIMMATYRYDVMLTRENNIYTVINPYTGSPFYCGSDYYSISTNQQCIEQLCLLYSYYKIRLNYPIGKIKEELYNYDFVFKEENKEYKMKYPELLDTFHFDFLKMEGKQSLYKIACYLCYHLNGDIKPMMKFVNHAYTYSYRYINKASVINGKYVGYTRCHFKYLDNYFEFTQNDEGKPLLKTTTVKIGLNKMAYLIALRLGHVNINWKSLSQEYAGFDIKKYVYENPKFDENGVNLCFNENRFFFDYKKESKNILPIILVKTINKQELTKNSDDFNLIPQIHENDFTVRLGRFKLFTMPFWRCRQYGNVCRPCKDIYLEGIAYKDIVLSRLLEKMPHVSEISFVKKPSIYLDNDVDNIVTTYLDRFNLNKKPDLHYEELPKKSIQEVQNDLKQIKVDIVLSYPSDDDDVPNYCDDMDDYEDFIDYEPEKQTIIQEDRNYALEVSYIKVGFSINYGKIKEQKKATFIQDKPGGFFINRIKEKQPFIFDYISQFETDQPIVITSEECYFGRKLLLEKYDYFFFSKDNETKIRYKFLLLNYFNKLKITSFYQNNKTKLHYYYDEKTNFFKKYVKVIRKYDKLTYNKFNKSILYYDNNIIILGKKNINNDDDNYIPDLLGFKDVIFLNKLTNIYEEDIDNDSDFEEIF